MNVRGAEVGRAKRQDSTSVYILAVLLAGLYLALGSACTAHRPVVSDAALGDAVRARLAAVDQAMGVDPRLVISKVTVNVSSGNVTLAGVVSEKDLRDAYVKATRQVDGVRTVADNITLLPDPSLGKTTLGIISAPVADLGDAPGQSTGSHRVTQALMGAVVDVLQEQGGWYHVRMADKYLGWISGRDLVRVTPEQAASWRKGEQARVVTRFATVYQEASVRSPAVTKVVMGTILPVLSAKTAGFVLAALPGGRQGYLRQDDVRIYASYVALTSVRGTPDDLLATALSLRGIRYLWGGSSPYGFDCSGFTQFVYGYNGFPLPRDTDMQFQSGQAIPDRAHLELGDLVFFSTYKAGPSHVGIYIGNGRYINAADPGVVIYSFVPTDPDYNATLDRQYIGARRVISLGH